MNRRYLMSSLVASLLLCLLASSFAWVNDVAAQSKRGEGIYLRGRVGANSYAGDRDMNPDNSFSDFFSNQVGFPSLGLDLGYNKRLGFINGGVALSYIGGSYENISSNFPCAARGDCDPGTPAVDDESSDWRHTLTLDAIIGFAPQATINPYLVLGLGGSYGGIFREGAEGDTGGTDFETVFTPKAGLGVDFALGRRVGLFLEITSLGMFPDDNIDLADGVEGEEEDPLVGGFDVLAFYGGGLRYNFNDPFTPVEVLALDCPATMVATESGTFTATVNEDEATPPLEYRWEFGDGTTATGLMASQTYQQEGNYTVTFTATNGENSMSSQTCSVAVEPAPQPPEIISLSATNETPRVDERVRFNSRVRGDAPIEYQWEFGDGETATGQDPAHTYQEEGTYTVTLTATNDAGSDSRSITVEVQPDIAAICLEITELNSAYFERNSSTLTAEAREALSENLDILGQCPNLNVRAEGFAAPGERNGQELSEARAEAVAQYYIDGGIEEGRVESVGRGTPSGVTSKKGGGDQYRRVDSIPLNAETGQQMQGGGGMGMDDDSDDMDMDDDNGMDMEDDGMDNGNQMGQGAQMGGQSIVEIVTTDPRFSTLAEALQATDLVSALQSGGPYTVFAPTNAAFEQMLSSMDRSSLDSFLDDETEAAMLRNVLLYHVVDGSMMAEDLQGMSSAPSLLQGQDVQVQTMGGDVMVGEATVTEPDVQASNGVVHVIDAVLMPPQQ